MIGSGVQFTLFDELRRSISADRLGTYLTAAGFDHDRALKLYVWNACIGEAFHLPVQGVEVALRNCVNGTLCTVFGDDWWNAPKFLTIADRERKSDIETAIRRIQNRGKPRVTSQIVANLSFGFWVGLLQPRYNPPIWAYHLKTSFINLPDGKNRYDLAASAKQVADLRNRIWHHEPIFRMDLSGEYRAVMELLTWLCPIKAAWLRPQCRVPGLLRQKP